MKVHLLIPQCVNLNCTYRFLELMKYQVFSEAPTSHGDSSNEIMMKNELGHDITVVISELREMNATSNSHKHLSVLETLSVREGQSIPFSLQDSDSYGVVTVQELKAIGIQPYYQRTYNRGNDNVEKIEVSYESEASLVLNKKSRNGHMDR